MHKFLLAGGLAATLVPSLHAQGALSSPCFIANLGAPLNLGDDQVAPANGLGFSFPGPGGAVTAIDISSNGFVWLGSNTNAGCCNGDPVTFLTDTARIAPMWMDLYPPGGGQVWFNTIPAAGTQPAGAVVTWENVPELGDVLPMTFQLQLWADGSFSFLYDARCYNAGHDVLTGCTEGVAAMSNAIDFATTNAGLPHLSGTNPTVLEVQTNTFDIADRMFVFIPTGSGGYLVIDRPPCPLADTTTFGVGCPKPASAYEFFQQPNLIDLSNTAIEFLPTGNGGFVGVPGTGFFTGYTNALAFQDDDVQGPFALPFPFTYPGGTTNSIDIASNGFIWLQSGSSPFNSRCCDADPAIFLADPASIAALWMDLYPPGGGSVYFDVGGGEAHITWAGVPEYFNGPAQTAQITLRANGSFRLAWGSVSNSSHDLLVGFTQGTSTIDPGSSDFSTGPVLIGAGGIPLKLQAQLGSRPALGSTFTLEVDQNAGALVGMMVLGVASFTPGIPLDGIGMEGCELYASLDVLLTYVLSGPPTPFGIAIANNPALLGATFYAQAATLTPGLNTLGIAASNGIGALVGY
ncbi:MAG: hypothetical protein JNK15_25600 [Planctomycetes bacterium]|nr:hypothetical protein [Planctomycetota bacterium]